LAHGLIDLLITEKENYTIKITLVSVKYVTLEGVGGGPRRCDSL